MKKILCPIDFSEASLNALEFAVAIGERRHSELVLLNIFTPADFDKVIESAAYDEKYNVLIAEAEKKLTAITKEINSRKNGLKSCEYKLKSGKIVDVMSDCVVEDHDDLVVMGTTGRSDQKGAYIGSKALQILQHTRSSVLCVPQRTEFKGISKVLYATDYQEEDKIAIQWVLKLTEIMGADLEVLHIAHHDHVIDKAIHEEYKLEMKEFIKNENVVFNMLVYHHVSEGLDKHMGETGADLLVLLDRKRNFFRRIFHPSLKKHLSQISEYPFIIIKL